MFIKKVPVQERERWRVLQERSAGNGQPYAIAMSGWDSASPLHQLVTKAFMRALALLIHPKERNCERSAGLLLGTRVGAIASEDGDAAAHDLILLGCRF